MGQVMLMLLAVITQPTNMHGLMDNLLLGLCYKEWLETRS